MAFGWHFVELNDEQKAERRIALDIAANIAQYSALIPLLFLQIYLLFIILGNKRSSQYGRFVAPSFYLNDPAGYKPQWSNRIRRAVTSFAWWTGTHVGVEWGTRGEWLFGAIWGAWLLLLSVAFTGNDYFHVTKRFGIVAASQLPLHYLMALKAPYSPLQLLTRLSHEQLNRGHQVLGRIITIFFYAHGILYLNSFIQAHSLLEHLKGRVVLLGLLGLISFTTINTTALSVLRNWSYRVFYITHVTLATLLLPILFFHVHHIRFYIWECLLIYVVHVVTRYACTRTHRGHISVIPQTDLVKIDIPVTPTSGTWRAGDHVYLTLPPQHALETPTDLLRRVFAGLRSNPFTVASLPARDGHIRLIARVRRGNTKQLATLARAQARVDVEQLRAAKVRLEGPYGAARYLPDLTTFDRVLLVAGGIGATFAVPIYRSALARLDAMGALAGTEEQRARKLKLLWLVGSEVDAGWGVPEDEKERNLWVRNAEVVVTGGKRGLANLRVDGDPYVKIKSGKKDDDTLGSNDDIELAEREGLLDEDINEQEDSEEAVRKSSIAMKEGGRERVSAYIDELFADANDATAAVLVCGPPGMARSVRAEVRRWAKQGRQVFFHAEEFGL